MHAREILELAGLASCHGRALMVAPGCLPQETLQRYWSASKCRLDRWARTLKGLGHAPPELKRGRRAAQAGYAFSVLEEILVAEVLTRVWTAVLVGYDHHRESKDAEVIARSIFIGHLEARQRTLQLLAHDPAVTTSQECMLLNRLRRRAEHWIDLLIGHLSVAEKLQEFAVHPLRAQEFADDLRRQPEVLRQQSWRLTLASLRAAFRHEISASSPNADVNGQIADSIVGCFPPEAFDSTGLLGSLWMARLKKSAADAELLIGDLFAAEEGQPRPPGFILQSELPPTRRRFQS
jgi:hypothetical protein